MERSQRYINATTEMENQPKSVKDETMVVAELREFLRALGDGLATLVDIRAVIVSVEEVRPEVVVLTPSMLVIVAVAEVECDVEATLEIKIG